MSLSDLSAIGSFVSGVGVIISLVYLGLQVRQAKRHQQGAIRQGRATRIVELLCSLSDTPMTQACLKGFALDPAISALELQQFQFFALALFYHYEDEYFQHQEGLTNKTAYASFVTSATRIMATPGLRLQWQQLRGDFIPQFTAFLDGLVAKAVPVTGLDPLAQWQADIAAARVAG